MNRLIGGRKKKIVNNSDLVFPLHGLGKAAEIQGEASRLSSALSVCLSVPSGDYRSLGTMRFLSMSKELPSGCTVTTSPFSWWTRRNPESSRPTIHTFGPSALPRWTCWALKRKNSPWSLGHVRGSGGNPLLWERIQGWWEKGGWAGTVKMHLGPSSAFHWSCLNCLGDYQNVIKSNRELGIASLANTVTPNSEHPEGFFCATSFTL